MKNKVLTQSMLSGLTLGAVIGVGLFLFNSPDSFTWHERLMSLLAAAIMALFSGVVLGAVFYLLERSRARKFDAFREELKESGTLLLEERGARIVDGRGRSGRMFLTDRALVFRASAAGEEGFDFLRSDLASVQISDPRRCYVTVADNSGREETFSVVDPREWFDLLGETLPKKEELPAETDAPADAAPSEETPAE